MHGCQPDCPGFHLTENRYFRFKPLEMEKGMTAERSRRRAIAFDPGLGTAVAVVTAVLMIGVYYANTHFGFEQPAVFFIVFLGIGHLLLNTAIPAFVVFVLCKEGWSGLGIRRENALLSLVISAVLAMLFVRGLLDSLEGFDGNPIPHIVFNGISLWEPLFVYGWLQLRFEKAFGFVLAPVIAGLAFAAYHIGSFPVDMLFVLFGFGVFYGIVFAFVRNILVLIPLTWAVGSSIGTIQGGFSFDWFTVGIYACVLLAQVIILYTLRQYGRKQPA